MPDAFAKALKKELTPAAPPPRGMSRVTLREVGTHLKPEDAHLNARKIALKFTNTPEGHMAWEKQSMATHKRVEDEGGAILVLGMRGLRQGTEDFKKAMQAWRDGDLELPTLADALGLKIENPDRFAPRASVQRRETNEELEARLKRQAEEKRTGIKLEKPTVIGR